MSVTGMGIMQREYETLKQSCLGSAVRILANSADPAVGKRGTTKRSPKASFAKDAKRTRGWARRFSINGLVFLVQIAAGDPWCSSC